MTQTAATGTRTTGTRKALSIEFGQQVTLDTHLGLVTGTATPVSNGWTLTDRNVEGHLVPFGNATRVTVVG